MIALCHQYVIAVCHQADISCSDSRMISCYVLQCRFCWMCGIYFVPDCGRELLVVLIGLVVIFRDQLTTIIGTIFERIASDSAAI